MRHHLASQNQRPASAPRWTERDAAEGLPRCLGSMFGSADQVGCADAVSTDDSPALAEHLAVDRIDLGRATR